MIKVNKFPFVEIKHLLHPLLTTIHKLLYQKKEIQVSFVYRKTSHSHKPILYFLKFVSLVI